MNEQDAFALVSCGVLLFLIVLSIAISVMWFVALIHAAVVDMESKAVWLLVIILGGPIGALVYFIARPYRQR